jgi:glutamate racemase
MTRGRREVQTAHAAVLGIVDWGVGGLGLYKLVKQRYPQLAVHYWSDAGATPYGKLPPAQLAARVASVIAQLREQGVTHVVIACNAASTILPRLTLRQSGMPQVVGVIEPTLAALRKQARRGVIGVVGGRRTIRGGSYRRGLPRHQLVQRVAQPISAFIEAGEINGPRLQTALGNIMKPLANVDTLVLACTHYPAIAPAFAALAPRATLVDPAALTFAWVNKHWQLASFAHGPDVMQTTGRPAAMQRGAKLAFAVELPTIVQRKL